MICWLSHFFHFFLKKEANGSDETYGTDGSDGTSGTDGTYGTDGNECPYPTWQGDGYCDDENNVESCDFDGGDCCLDSDDLGHVLF